MLATSYPSGQNISSARCRLSVGRWNDFFVRGAFYPGLPMDVSSLHLSARSTWTKVVVGPFRLPRVYARTFLSRAATAARPLHPGLKTSVQSVLSNYLSSNPVIRLAGQLPLSGRRIVPPAVFLPLLG